jgi:hypothetical protein
LFIIRIDPGTGEGGYDRKRSFTPQRHQGRRRTGRYRTDAEDRGPRRAKRGGGQVVGLNGGAVSNSLDPATYSGTYPSVIGSQLYNLLVEIDEKIGPQPCLAESWEFRPGAREWIVKLRRGVTFSNGRTLTAANVVYSLNHHRRPDTKSAAKALLASVVDVKATAQDEVTLSLSSGHADIPYVLGTMQLCIGPEGSSFTNGIGTGPYTLEATSPACGRASSAIRATGGAIGPLSIASRCWRSTTRRRGWRHFSAVPFISSTASIPRWRSL